MSYARSTKRCSGCAQFKPLSDFHKNSWGSSGVQGYCKLCIKKYAESDPNKNMLACRRYRAKHPERRRESVKKWASAHPENGCAKTMRYAARKLKAELGDQKLVSKIYARAAELRQWFDVEVDHILALVNGGAHSADNLQIIYKKENRSKGARLDYIPSVVFV